MKNNLYNKKKFVENDKNTVDFESYCENDTVDFEGFNVDDTISIENNPEIDVNEFVE